jgi:mannose-1-phosphate guanylyltransferase/phosphomannomutase
VSGLINVEITPEHVVRLASAYATSLRKGVAVTTSRDVSRAARALKRAAIAALNASAIDVHDLEVCPTPVTRFVTASTPAQGGIMFRTTPGDAQSIDIVFLDAEGADLSASAQRKLERVYSRQEFRRAFPGEIAELSFPTRSVDTYVRELLETVDVSGVRDAALKVVVDTTGGAATLVLPSLLGRLGVDALTVNGRLDEMNPTETVAGHMHDLERLASLVAASGAAFGVKFDNVGERIFLVDETGSLIHDDRALLVVLDLVAAERRSGQIALPVTTTRVAESVTKFHGVDIMWTAQAADEIARAARGDGVVFAGDGRGGYVVPEFSSAFDGIAAFVRLLGLVARTRLSLSQIDHRIPQASVQRRSVPTPWAAKGLVMRQVVEAAADAEVDTTDGIRVVGDDGSWILVLPDPSEAVTHLWAEGGVETTATALLDRWAAVVEGAGR